MRNTYTGPYFIPFQPLCSRRTFALLSSTVSHFQPTWRLSRWFQALLFGHRLLQYSKCYSYYIRPLSGNVNTFSHFTVLNSCHRNILPFCGHTTRNPSRKRMRYGCATVAYTDPLSCRCDCRARHGQSGRSATPSGWWSPFLFPTWRRFPCRISVSPCSPDWFQSPRGRARGNPDELCRALKKPLRRLLNWAARQSSSAAGCSIRQKLLRQMRLTTGQINETCAKQKWHRLPDVKYGSDRAGRHADRHSQAAAATGHGGNARPDPQGHRSARSLWCRTASWSPARSASPP